MIRMTNLQIIQDWNFTNGPQPTTDSIRSDYDGLTPTPLTTNGLPPPPG